MSTAPVRKLHAVFVPDCSCTDFCFTLYWLLQLFQKFEFQFSFLLPRKNRVPRVLCWALHFVKFYSALFFCHTRRFSKRNITFVFDRLQEYLPNRTLSTVSRLQTCVRMYFNTCAGLYTETQLHDVSNSTNLLNTLVSRHTCLCICVSSICSKSVNWLKIKEINVPIKCSQLQFHKWVT